MGASGFVYAKVSLVCCYIKKSHFYHFCYLMMLDLLADSFDSRSRVHPKIFW